MDVLRCYVSLYLESKDMKKLYGAEKIRALLDGNTMQALITMLYQEWLGTGADSKTKGMMTLYSIHSGDQAVRDLKAQVKDFDYKSRSAMAGDAVRAIAASGSTMSLVTVDTLGRTYQNKLVRRMAAEALEEAAKLQGLTVEQLADKIVPTLGLDEKGELHLATDQRSWIAKLGADLKITLYNSEGKKISALPVIGKGEDDVKYEEVKEALSLLKKELRTLVSGQTQRLELALSSQRSWTKEGFEELFVKNPIMEIFASSLIFTQDENTFRYNGDGSYSNQNDDTYATGNGEIRLAHPLNLAEDVKSAWRKQLADYECAQPFPQLDRKIYTLPKEEESKTSYDRFKGTMVNGGGFVRRLFKSDWQRGDLGDAGSYYDINKTIGDYTAEVNFGDIDDFCVGNEFDTSIELEDLCFIKTADKRELPLKDVPPILYSETVYTVEAAIAGAQVKDN
jgi:hypothetical protein